MEKDTTDEAAAIYSKQATILLAMELCTIDVTEAIIALVLDIPVSEAIIVTEAMALAHETITMGLATAVLFIAAGEASPTYDDLAVPEVRYRKGARALCTPILAQASYITIFTAKAIAKFVAVAEPFVVVEALADQVDHISGMAITVEDQMAGP